MDISDIISLYENINCLQLADAEIQDMHAALIRNAEKKLQIVDNDDDDDLKAIIGFLVNNLPDEQLSKILQIKEVPNRLMMIEDLKTPESKLIASFKSSRIVESRFSKLRNKFSSFLSV